MSTKKGYIPNPDILTLNKVNENDKLKDNENLSSKGSKKRFNEDRFIENNSSNLEDSISSAQNSSKMNLNNEKVSLINNFKERNNQISKIKTIESDNSDKKKGQKAIIELKKMDSKSSRGNDKENRLNTKTFQEDDEDEDENFGQRPHLNIRKLIKKEKIVSLEFNLV